MLVEINPFMSSARFDRTGQASEDSALGDWVLAHQRDRALFLPERRVVARFIVHMTRTIRTRRRAMTTRGISEVDARQWNPRLLRCARQATWELLAEQDEAEKGCAAFDALETDYYGKLGERLGLDTFRARRAAIRLNEESLAIRQRIQEILFHGTQPLPGESLEGQRTAEAYRAIRRAGHSGCCP